MPKIKRWHYQRAKRIADSVINTVENIQHQSSASLGNASLLSNSNISLAFESDDSADVKVDSDSSEQVNNASSNFEENELINHSDYDSDDKVINFIVNDPVSLVDDSLSFVSWLQEWAIKNHISHVALNELLNSIKPKYPELPSDARSLLRTPRKIIVKDVKPGQYYHFGLRNCIEQLVSQNSVQLSQIVKVNINVDGLPLFKSSSSQVYPILCNLVENYDLVNIIGIYYGNEKPSDANVFLTDFVEEAITLSNHGIQINDQTYQFTINAFVCDVPAKALIKFTRGHNGYYSCTKCTAKGIYIFNDRVMTYPYLTSNSHPLRTDNDFRAKLQSEHHTGTSILESIPNIDMIQNFPSDPMHLLYLGIVKKLIVNLWCYGKPRSKLSFNEMSKLSTLLVAQKNNVPCEINRKPRSLSECKRWKASEFRTFLLYTGPVILKDILSHDKYINFLSLHVAITIMSNAKHIDRYSEYAKDLLEYFVKTFIILYGKKNASTNIHHLLHLHDDVVKFGTLQEFSAFPFENYLQSILKMIRKNSKVLEQIVCRISEQNSCITGNNKCQTLNSEPELQNPHFNGPLVNYLNSKLNNTNQFNQVAFDKYILKTKEPDNCCSLIDETVVVIKNFISNDEGHFVIGHKYKSRTDFYSEPCNSSKLGIYLVDALGHLQAWNLKKIAHKCLKLEYKNKYVVFPLLHSK